MRFQATGQLKRKTTRGQRSGHSLTSLCRAVCGSHNMCTCLFLLHFGRNFPDDDQVFCSYRDAEYSKQQFDI